MGLDNRRATPLHALRRRDREQLALSRRDFLQLVAASAVVSQAGGCASEPPKPALPYTHRSPGTIPGRPVHYATSLLIDGLATGLIAQTREGRPIKIEGNPDHPASLGATSALHQAALWQLYDPDRARSVLRDGAPASWIELRRVLAGAPDLGHGLCIVVEPTSSPLVHDMVRAVKRRKPAAKVTFYAPLASDAPIEASAELFGSPLSPRYDLSRARVIVALDADLLGDPCDLSHARHFAEQRAPADPQGELSRLYVIEADMSVTGTMADERLARPRSRVALLAGALANELALPALAARAQALGIGIDGEEQRFISALARDLRRRAPGETLIVAGPHQPREAHVLAYAMNEALGNVGSGLSFVDPVVPHAASDQTLGELTAQMKDGNVSTLVMIGVNPVYDCPADLGFTDALARVPSSVCVDLYRTETAERSRWFAPLLHPFESWGDGRGPDGTLSFVQPLIGALRSGATTSELLAVIAREPVVDDLARLRARFGAERGESGTLAMSEAEQNAQTDPAVQAQWERVLAQGFMPGSAYERRESVATAGVAARALDALIAREPARGIELSFAASPTLHDGRFSNVAWLLELPAPVSKLTWDNAALMSASTARALAVPGAQDHDTYPMVRITREQRSVELPAVVVPGHADGAVSLWLGYGRRGALELARGAGFDVQPLRTSLAPWFCDGAVVEPLAKSYPLAVVQPHRDMRDRPLALRATLERYRAEPDFTAEHKGPLPSLLSDYRLSGPQWAMTIDLSKCTGCSACVVACQAENNVMVVGKDQVRRGRIMHWLRIDSYETPKSVIHQPMACQHCEKAPCEYVCPVNATEHSPDGLNEMVYNRCVGTRFCSNNCPYKVRRFNWLDWTERSPGNGGELELQRNPEVTVRARGVMEKCTYCVQRIRAAEIDARKEDRALGTGEVVTACQQACPTRAISFGSLEHEDAEVVRWRQQARSYAVLHETGARPRTMYLARIDNPNPELER